VIILAWEDRYHIRAPGIDEQHRRLFGVINDLHQAMVDGATRESLGGILRRLMDYADYHFDTEKQLMETGRYPGLLRHVREHEDFRRRVGEFEKEFLAGRRGLTLELMEFLRGWLTNHILVQDKRYDDFLARRGPAPTVRQEGGNGGRQS
jgi:hemerythrin